MALGPVTVGREDWLWIRVWWQPQDARALPMRNADGVESPGESLQLFGSALGVGQWVVRDPWTVWWPCPITA